MVIGRCRHLDGRRRPSTRSASDCRELRTSPRVAAKARPGPTRERERKTTPLRFRPGALDQTAVNWRALRRSRGSTWKPRERLPNDGGGGRTPLAALGTTCEQVMTLAGRFNAPKQPTGLLAPSRQATQEPARLPPLTPTDESTVVEEDWSGR